MSTAVATHRPPRGVSPVNRRRAARFEAEAVTAVDGWNRKDPAQEDRLGWGRSQCRRNPFGGFKHYCRDLNSWPRSWMGLETDLPPGEQLVTLFRPLLL